MRFTAAFVLAMIALPAQGGEVLVLGRVKEITLLPEGHARCESLCPTDAEATEEICISNGCGCGEAKIQVESVILGKRKLRTHIAPYRLGEFCMADFPLDGQLILVRTESGESQWGPAHRTPDGDTWVEVDTIVTIGGMPVADLPKVEGRISLNALKARK